MDAETEAKLEVVREELRAVRDSVSRIESSIEKRDLVLFGPDGRGGITADMTILNDAQKRQRRREMYFWWPALVALVILVIGLAVSQDPIESVQLSQDIPTAFP